MFVRRLLVVALSLFILPSTALAQSATGTGTITGTAKTVAGAPVSGASVTASGPTRSTVTTDRGGNFTLTLPPGIYRVTVTKGGYVPATSTDLAVFSGESLPLNVTMTEANLTSLRTIATVSTQARGSSINTGTAAINYLPAQAITDYASPQINDVLQHLPNTVIQKMGSQPDTTIVLGGVQPYETQVLIDGHPLSMGQFGVWLSEYFSSFLVAGVETQTGPGNTTPFANTAVGGTANILTPTFTSKPTFNLVMGADSYQSQYSNLLLTDNIGKFQYVFGVGYGSENGPYFQGNHCVIYPENPANDNTPQSAGIIQFCGDSSGSLFTKGEILKVRYNFSPQTSFDVGFIGAQGGYLPQGTSYGNYIGVTTILGCFPTGEWTLNGVTQPSVNLCTNPANSNLIGKSIDGYTWYPGSNVYSNQPIFTGQLRTSIGNTTILVRPYAGNIERIIDGQDEQNYPYFWSEPGTVPSGGTNPNSFELYCNNGTDYDGFTINPDGTGPVVNGQEECNQTVFSEFEQDKLYGNTLSFLHPIGDNLVTLTWDFHGDNTFAYYDTPSDIATPNTTERYNTISLTGDWNLTHSLLARFGVYETNWHLSGSQPQPGAPAPAPLVPLTRSISRFDPHIGLVYQPRGNLSYRAAWGTSETFPFSAQVSGEPEVTPESLTFPYGFVTQKNPFLDPETTSEFSVGADMRVRNGGVFSLDLQNDNIRNVFESVAIPNAIPVTGQPIGYALITPFNAASLRTELALLRYSYEPHFGLGYNAAFSFESSIVRGIPVGYYALGPGLPANDQQICGFGEATPGTPTCIPYMKGYGQLTYGFHDGTYTALGMDFEGKNNTYFQPPFVQFDLTYRKPLTNEFELQFSVQNLLNTNNFYNLPMPNAGVSTVAEQTGGGLTTLPSSMIPAPPRTLRLQVRWHSPN